MKVSFHHVLPARPALTRDFRTAADSRVRQNPLPFDSGNSVLQPSTINSSVIILDTNAQVCFHKSMEAEQLTKINRARRRARCAG
jgi:hypothetical protein